MKKTKEPIAVTVNGKAETIAQDAKGYQELLDLKDRMDTINVLRNRLASLKRNRGISAEEFFNEFFAEHGFDNL